MKLDCVMSTITDKKFKITNTKLYVPIVTLSTKDNVKLSKQLNKEFKRPVYWNAYIIIQNVFLMLLSKELKDYLFLLLTTLLFLMIQLTIPIIELKKYSHKIFFSKSK